MARSFFILISFLSGTILAAKPFGLPNLENTCYMNATLQALLNIPEFVTALKKFSPPSALSQSFLSVSRQEHLAQSLEDFYGQVDSLFFPSDRLNTFKQIFGSIVPEIEVANRIKATEKEITSLGTRRSDPKNILEIDKINNSLAKKKDMLDFLSSLQQSIKSNVPPSDIEHSLTKDKQLSYEQQDAEEFYTLFIGELAKKSPEVRKLFGITLASSLDKNAPTLAHDQLLALPAAPSWDAAAYSSVQKALDIFCSEERVEFGGRKDVPKHTTIREVSQILTVQLKRFVTIFDKGTGAYASKRISAEIAVTNPLILTKKEHGIDAEYTLESIVVQKGELQGGHYVAYVKSYEDGLWYFCNDSSVTPLGKDLVPYGGFPYGPNAYLLFYRQVSHPEIALKNFAESLQGLAQALGS